MSYEIVNTSDESSGESQLALVGEFCVFNAAEVKPQLFELIQAGAAQEIDLSQVSEIDTAGVQLLLMAKRVAASVERELVLVNHSEAVLEIIELLNLSRDFSDPLLLTAHNREDHYES